MGNSLAYLGQYNYDCQIVAQIYFVSSDEFHLFQVLHSTRSLKGDIGE